MYLHVEIKVLQQIKRLICLKLFPIFAGLRGAVGFSLVEILDNTNPYKNLFVTTTLFMIAFTVFLQGGTIKLFVEKLKIRKKVAAVRIKLNLVPLLSCANRPVLTAHLSKGSSGLKRKCTQFHTPFSGIVFHALSHGAIHFVRSVSFKKPVMEVCDCLLRNFNQRESGFSS